jgi:hypothetical protein
MRASHSYEYTVDGRDEANGRVVYSRATCECGWDGPEYRDCDHLQTKRDYRAHVFEALGEDMAFYTAPVVCINCTYEGPADLLVGTDVFAGTCPMCGASGRLRPNGEAWNHERERTKDWFR